VPTIPREVYSSTASVKKRLSRMVINKWDHRIPDVKTPCKVVGPAATSKCALTSSLINHAQHALSPSELLSTWWERIRPHTATTVPRQYEKELRMLGRERFE
jgi:hypothetical protein